MATKEAGIPKSDAPMTAAEGELAGGSGEVKGNEKPLNVDNPKVVSSDGKTSPELQAFAEANQKFLEAQTKADDSHLTPEQKAANEAAQKADDARAKANEAAASSPVKNATVADVGTLAVVDPDTSVGDHYAQKFGNDPANPKLAPGVKPDQDLVRLSRITPDFPGTVFCEVPRIMVGDYERAGWNRA